MDQNYPSVSILIPTLNAEKALNVCLESIKIQDYPKEKIEIVVADGGSTDDTVKIAKEFGARVYENPLKTGEAGKAIALKNANNELVALIDSDNILPDPNWFKSMVAPFSDPEIIGSEPWEFSHRSEDGFITRYCALLGANDPYCYFTGVYDRKSVLSGKWTGLKMEEKDEGEYLKISIKDQELPTIGANGTIWRKSKLLSVFEGDYLFDIDILSLFLEKENEVKFAKVKTGIVHHYCGSDIKSFVTKQKRRIDDLFYHGSLGQRKFKWGKVNRGKILYFILPTILIAPLFYEVIKGYSIKKDRAWLFHPLACWLTLGVYSLGFLRFYLWGPKKPDRSNWKQSA